MRIAIIQTAMAWLDPKTNFAALAQIVAEAGESKPDLILLPEMFSTGFAPSADISEARDGPSTHFLANMAVLTGARVGGTYAEDAGDGQGGSRNVFLIAGPDGSEERYAKRHLFSHGGEDRNYKRGTEPKIINIAGVRCHLSVCYDLRFVDIYWGLAERTDAYLVVANWPSERAEHWTTLLRARAIENQAYVVGVNRVGVGGKLTYAGGSMVVDPWGEIVVKAGFEPQILQAEIDPDRVRAVREEFPVLADRLV